MKTPLAIVLSVVLAAGVVAANQLGAQTTPTVPTSAPAAATIATVQSIVEITRAVPAGPTAVDAFTVPAGVMLVVTDIVVTNAGTAAACGGAVNRAAGTATVSTPTAATGNTGTPTATTPTLATPPATTAEPAPAGTSPVASTSAPAATATTSVGTLTQTDSTVTGPLCVPAQTTTTLPLTTGIEFGGGQVVQLLNAPTPAATTGPAGAPSSLAFHLRGVLITLT